MRKNQPRHTICVCERMSQVIPSVYVKVYTNTSRHTFHISMSHVTRVDKFIISGDSLGSMAVAVFHTICVYIKSYTNASRHTFRIWMSHVAVGELGLPRFSQLQWLLPYVIPSACTDVYMNASRHTYEAAMSRIWMSHVTCVNGSCHTCGWIEFSKTFQSQWLLPYVIPSACTNVYIKASFHTHEWATSHIWVSHVTCMNESCHTCGCIGLSKTFPFQGHMAMYAWMRPVTHVTCEWATSRIWMSHVTRVPVSNFKGVLILATAAVRHTIYKCIHGCIM